MAALLERTRAPYDDRGLFPNHWGTEGATPNCLGILLILLNYARRTSSPFRMVNLIEMNGSRLAGITGSLYEIARQDIETRFLIWEGDVLNQMQDRAIRGKYPGLGVLNFHHALAIRLCDSSWFLLDPFAQTWGSVPAQWQMETLEQSLQNAEEERPGLILTTGYVEGFEQLAKQSHDLLRTAIVHSQRMEAKLEALVADWSSGTEYLDIADTDPFQLFQQKAREHPAWTFLDRLHPIDLLGSPLRRGFTRSEIQDPDIRFMLATLEIGDAPDSLWLEQERVRFHEHPEYRIECACRLLSRFHFWSISRYFRQSKKIVSRDLHPWIEVCADPYLSVGLFAANSLRHAQQKGAAPGLLNHTSSQLIAREVLHNPTTPDRIARRIMSHLQNLPALHCLVRQTLQEVAQRKGIDDVNSGRAKPPDECGACDENEGARHERRDDP